MELKNDGSVVVQLLSCVQLFATPWTAASQVPLFSTISCSLPKFISIESVMPSNHLILCHPLLFPPSVFPSIRVFSSESVLHIRWPKYSSFTLSISPTSEYSGLISFRMDWLDLLAVQGTLKSLVFGVSIWSKEVIMVKWGHKRASQVVLVVKNTPANAGDIRDTGSIPGSGRSPGGGHGNQLQCSCLENPTVGYSP